MNVRAAGAADLAALAPVLAQLPLLRNYALGAAALKARLLRARAEGDCVWVATGAAGAPLGLVWFVQRGTLSTGAYVRLLAAAPGHPGAGLGRVLLEAVHRACQAAPGGIFVLCSEDNAGGQRLYLRCGYRPVGPLPGFVRPERTEMLLWRPRESASASAPQDLPGPA
jgi:GNAT superfamily N-acetyltransferase